MRDAEHCETDMKHSTEPLMTKITEAWLLIQALQLDTSLQLLSTVRQTNDDLDDESHHVQCLASNLEARLLLNLGRLEESREISTEVLLTSARREVNCQEKGLECFAFELYSAALLLAEVARFDCHASSSLSLIVDLVDQLNTKMFAGYELAHPVLDVESLDVEVDRMNYFLGVLGHSPQPDDDFAMLRSRAWRPSAEFEATRWSAPPELTYEHTQRYLDMFNQSLYISPVDSDDVELVLRDLESHYARSSHWTEVAPYSSEAHLSQMQALYEKVSMLLQLQRLDAAREGMTHLLQQFVDAISAEHVDVVDLSIAQWCNELSYRQLVLTYDDEESRKLWFWIAKWNLDFADDVLRGLIDNPIRNEVALAIARTSELLGIAEGRIGEYSEAARRNLECFTICEKLIAADPANKVARDILEHHGSSFEADTAYLDTAELTSPHDEGSKNWNMELVDVREILSRLGL